MRSIIDMLVAITRNPLVEAETREKAALLRRKLDGGAEDWRDVMRAMGAGRSL